MGGQCSKKCCSKSNNKSNSNSNSKGNTINKKQEESQETKAAPPPRQYERWNSDIRKDCDIHAEDEQELMHTYNSRKEQMLKAAEDITGLRLEPYVPTPDEAWGTYEIKVNPKYSGGYCVKQFTIDKQDVIPVDEAKGLFHPFT